jgi:hypothetical protein
MQHGCRFGRSRTGAKISGGPCGSSDGISYLPLIVFGFTQNQ